LLARARRGAPIPVVQYLGTLGHTKIPTLRWRASSQAVRASPFSGDAQGLQQLTPLDIHDLGIFLAEARYQNWIVLLSLHRAQQWAQRMHLAPANAGQVENFKPSEVQICQKLTAPLVPSGSDAFAEPGDMP
jgi:hypothetical protein